MENSLQTQDSLKRKYSTYHVLSLQTTHKLAYQKLEKDLEKAVSFVVQNLSSNDFKSKNDR